jgi:hypothetical protein
MNGFFDGTVFGKMHLPSYEGPLKDPEDARVISLCMAPWPPSQAVAVVDKYLKDNPQKQGHLIWSLVGDAIFDACLKKRQPKP